MPMRERWRGWSAIFARKGLGGGLGVLRNSALMRLGRALPVLEPALPLMPQTLDLEVSAVCNLRCAGCLHGIEGGAFLRPQQKHMRQEQFRDLLSQVGQTAHALNLTTFGETFLNPDIYDIIACAKGHGLLAQVDTNGHALDFGRVLDCGLDTITFAVDGMTQESYQTYRRGGRLATVLGNIAALHDLARRRGSPLAIEAKFIVHAFNEHEIEAARAHFAALPGVRFFTGYFRVPAPDWAFYRQHPFATTRDLHALWAPRARQEYDLYVEDPETGLMQLGLLAMPFRNLCPAMHRGMYIHAGGDAYPCCHAAGMEHPDFLMGNVFEQGVAGVFRGGQARAMRREYDASGGRYSFCARCIANRLPGVPLRNGEEAGRTTPSTADQGA